MTEYITPSSIPEASDAERIQEAIWEAKRRGVGTVLIPRRNEAKGEEVWIIDKTILLPSDITVILDGCHLRMADGVFCRMFENENAEKPVGLLPEGAQHNIHLIGRGGATLDGGLDNGLCEKTGGKNGLPSVWNNLTVYFHNVHHFSISGLTVRDQRWWAICFMYSSFGKVSDIHFEITKRYQRGIDTETGYWRNQDGIDLRVGCHDITVAHITGETGDDVIACTALAGEGGYEAARHVAGASKHIYNVNIRDVKATCNLCAVVRLLAHRRNQLYNVVIDGVYATERDGVRADTAIRLNEHSYYGNDIANKLKMGEMRSIFIKNVFAETVRSALLFSGELCDISVRDVTVAGDAVALHTLDRFGSMEVFNRFKNFRLSGIHAKNVKHFVNTTEENVVLRDLFETE